MLGIVPRQLSLFRAFSPPAPEPIAPPGPPEPVVSPPRPAESVASSLRARLTEAMAGELGSLTLTNNRTRILSARPRPDGKILDVRIHRSFADASDTTLRAVVRFLRAEKGSARRRRALAEIRRHFATHAPSSPPRPARRALQPVGRALDLREIRDDLNAEYFGGQIEASITWGRAGASRRRRGKTFSVRLGSYSERDQLIRVHRCLDSADVPRFVVESVVHHEMLHADLPVEIHNGRRRLHTPEFRRRERLFRQFAEAEAWLEAHLGALASRC